MIKIYILVVVLGLVGGVVYGGFSYYKDTQARKQTLAENSAKLEQAAKIQEETIETMIKDREKFEKINKELQGSLQKAETYGDQLRATLQKHNLTHLANKKPKHIERKMQNATNRLWDCLADITNPDRVWDDAGAKSNNCNKNSKNPSSNSSKTETSTTK